MGRLSRVLGRPRATFEQALTLHADEIVEVVGESYRQDVLRRVAAKASDMEPFLEELEGYARTRASKVPGRRFFRAALIREPDNPHDSNAIAVHAAAFGRVGYLSRDDAVEYLPIFDELARQGCEPLRVSCRLFGLSLSLSG